MPSDDIAQVQAIQDVLQSLSDRLYALTAGNPTIHCDQFVLARGQINSAARYLEMGLRKVGGTPAAPGITPAGH